MSHVAVIGATGEVGQGIVQALLARGHHVTAIGRSAARLDVLPAHPAQHLLAGSLDSDETAASLAAELKAPDAIIVSVNGPRITGPILSHSSAELAALVTQDLVTHYTAARALLPLLPPHGTYIAIGGGSADFILEGGAHLSAAQAGLRMLFRGLAHEHKAPHIKLLTVASVVTSPATQEFAHPLWVTNVEIGEHAAAILENPEAYQEPVWRISRRGDNGLPGFAPDAPTRVQGFRQEKESK